jgi:hypothetical protein
MRTPKVSLRTYNLMSSAWPLCIGTVSLIGAILFFFFPDALRSISVAHTIGPLESVWNLARGIGGACIIYGIVRNNRQIDALGLVLFATSMAVNSIALAYTYGAQSLSVQPTLVACLIAALTRVAVVADLVVPRHRGSLDE